VTALPEIAGAFPASGNAVLCADRFETAFAFYGNRL